jgi:hypothetical protein
MDAFLRQRNEIPEVVIRSLRLREVAIRLLFGCMNQIGKLDSHPEMKNTGILFPTISPLPSLA